MKKVKKIKKNIKITGSVGAILSLIEEKNITKISDFAKNLNISPAGVHGHIKKLEKRGAIKKSYLINYTKFGLIPVIFLLEFFQPLDRGFIKKINEYGNVKKVMKVQGDFDYLVLALFDNEEQMRHFMTSILVHNDKIRNSKIVILGRDEYI